jgi:hypothetical protein
VLAPRRRGIGEVIAALAQEAPAYGAAHVQRAAQLIQVLVDRPHAVSPSTRSTAVENARHSCRDAFTARRPAGVSR